MHLSQKQEMFSGFFEKFLESTLNFKRFPKSKSLIADVCPKLRTSKYVLK